MHVARLNFPPTHDAKQSNYDILKIYMKWMGLPKWGHSPLNNIPTSGASEFSSIIPKCNFYFCEGADFFHTVAEFWDVTKSAYTPYYSLLLLLLSEKWFVGKNQSMKFNISAYQRNHATTVWPPQRHHEASAKPSWRQVSNDCTRNCGTVS